MIAQNRTEPNRGGRIDARTTVFTEDFLERLRQHSLKALNLSPEQEKALAPTFAQVRRRCAVGMTFHSASHARNYYKTALIQALRSEVLRLSGVPANV